jgi:putative membrane protein
MFLVRLVINVLSLLAVFFLIWGVKGYDAVVTAIVMAVVLAVINTFIRPVVILLTLPVTLLTLGLFGVVINLMLFYVAAIVVGIHVPFWLAALGWLGYVIIASALNKMAIYEW